MKVIGHVECLFNEKFGLPRQSGLVNEIKARIIFEPEFRTWDAFKGIEEYSHIWILWNFSESKKDNWSATVKPPRLGGNQRMGVFATRSPFRPNPIGMSCVKLEKAVYDEKLGTILYIQGSDMMNGTPVYDIKPYIPYTDSHPEAVGGFADKVFEHKLSVEISKELQMKLSEDELVVIIKIIEQDPRPSYINDEKRLYGVTYGNKNVKFKVKETLATIAEIEEV
ncbi:MAG: tRNA (N6-threonylcarbamoyladenosine(37)-N6)-methyltransferase TrmO [Lachnospiraceae bacterium]|nr:tRNA (N6-threonylcarbamoyladenosine(37)-N6)-methyltransferase TrmO [Lachnospiraceae bacterium]